MTHLVGLTVISTCIPVALVDVPCAVMEVPSVNDQTEFQNLWINVLAYVLRKALNSPQVFRTNLSHLSFQLGL
jgi:hypothetical protein